MNEKWKPTKEQQIVIARTIEFISDELAELQEELRCPNSFIAEIAENILSPYKTEAKVIRRSEE